MTEQEWQRAKPVIALALECEPEARAAVLSSHCDGDAEFLAQLERMLSDYEEGTDIGHFLATQAARRQVEASPLPATVVDPQDLQAPQDRTPRGVHDGDRQVWGDFVLLEELGRGGFGVVYRAWERTLRREVALKLIDSTLYPARRESIQREGQMLARIDHPNVVRIYGIHRNGAELAIAMEYVRGRTLANLVESNGPFAPREAAQTIASVADALTAVHRGGLIHRDIKASNVMRSHDGRIVLMDFGAGRDLHRQPDTRTRMIGTPVYMAPEILDGAHATPASDVYSLGVLLYVLLTGRHPDPPVPEAPGTHATDAWAKRALAGTPEALAVLVGRMLAPEPSQRPPMDATLTRDLLRATKPPRQPRSPHPSPAAGTVNGSRAQPPVPSPPQPVPFAGPAPPESTASTLTWQRVTVGVLSSVLLCGALGVLSTVEYNAVLGRHGAFAAEPVSKYFEVGLKSLLLPTTLMLMAVVAIALVMLSWRIVRAVAPGVAGRLGRLGDRARDALTERQLFTRETAEQAVCLVGLVAFVLTLWSYSDFLAALTTPINDGPATVFGVLHSGLRTEKGNFRTLLFMVMLGMVASLAFTRRLPRDGASPITSGSVLAMTALVGLVVAGSWRVMYTKDYREVLYGSDRCYVLGESTSRWLLHCPGQPPPRNREVPVDDARLKVTGNTGSLFDAYPSVAGYDPKPEP